jgi:hypothetical protein
MRTTRLLVSGTVAAALLLAATGCAEKYSAERDGKDLGEALCDLREAEPDEVDAALADVEDELGDLADSYALFTAEDRADIDENLSDLAEHVADGNTALIQQDLAVIRRSAGNVREDVDETASAAWDGILQGLDTCVA